MNKIAARRRPHPAHCTEGGIIDQCQRAASAAMKPIPPEHEEQDWDED